MSVTMDPGLGSQQYEDFEFHGREAIVRFDEFGRDESGEIRVLEKPVYECFQDQGGQWFRRGEGEQGPTPISADEVETQDNVYWQFEIVSPAEFAGKHLPLRGALKGIVVKKAPDGKWHFNLPRRSMGLDDAKFKVGLYVIAEKCGLDLAALDTESQMYDPDYVSEGLEALNQIVQADMPLREVDVLEHIIEAKLKEAADRGLLLKVKTSDRSNWIQYGSVTPLTSEQAARFQEAEAGQQDEAETLRDHVRAMIPSDGADRQVFLKDVYNKAVAIHPGLPTSGMLDALNASELQQLVAQLQGASEEMSL